MTAIDGLILTEDEFDEIFGDHVVDREASPQKPWRLLRFVGALAAFAVFLTGITAAASVIRNTALISAPAEIREQTLEFVEQSEWGWLVQGVVAEPIIEPSIAGYVTRDPADGVIHIDRRPWSHWGLEMVTEHEIGHLLDFAAYPNRRNGQMRGGLETEVWAECAAVAADTRSTDRNSADQVYRCTDAELATFRQAVADIVVVCRTWGDFECREFP